MPQPNKGSAAPSAPTAAPIQNTSRPSANAGPGGVHFGAPGGTGTRGK